jgi:TonB family protein
MTRETFTIAVMAFLGGVPAPASPILIPEQLVRLAIYTPQPVYSAYARGRRITGNGLFILRIQIQTGRVKDVQIAHSTGSELLDSAATRALQQWRFKPGALPPIRVQLPNRKDAFANEDSLIRIPMSFVLTRNGVITKGSHTGLSIREAMSRDAQIR